MTVENTSIVPRDKNASGASILRAPTSSECSDVSFVAGLDDTLGNLSRCDMRDELFEMVYNSLFR